MQLPRKEKGGAGLLTATTNKYTGGEYCGKAINQHSEEDAKCPVTKTKDPESIPEQAMNLESSRENKLR